MAEQGERQEAGGEGVTGRDVPQVGAVGQESEQAHDERVEREAPVAPPGTSCRRLDRTDGPLRPPLKVPKHRLDEYTPATSFREDGGACGWRGAGRARARVRSGRAASAPPVSLIGLPSRAAQAAARWGKGRGKEGGARPARRRCP